MLKKIDAAKLFLEKNVASLQCPFCHQSLHLTNYSVRCNNHHQFDLSKKGTLFFLSHAVQTDYNQKMFYHRSQMIQSGMYQPLIKKLLSFMDLDGKTLDVGCGEGSFLKELTNAGLTGIKWGFDLSKDGIYLATNQGIEAFWCVADLTNLPFATSSITTILNIFSPSHYQEFQRILTPKGSVLKVIPEENYLKELRQAFYPDEKKKQTYSNQKVMTRFSEELIIEENERLTYVFEIPENNRLDLLEMSPLEWQVSKERKQFVQENPLEKVTIDVRIVKGRKK